MVSIKQIERGAAKYIDQVVAPEIPVDVPNGQIKKIAALTGAAYAVKRGVEKLTANQKTLVAIGAMDGNGNVDAEGIAEMFKAQIPKDGFKVKVPILGNLTFTTEDVDRLVSCITEGE